MPDDTRAVEACRLMALDEGLTAAGSEGRTSPAEMADVLHLHLRDLAARGPDDVAS